MMKKLWLGNVLFLLLIYQSSLIAQQTVSTGGGDASGSNGSVSYTLGQTSFESKSGINGSVSEGVQQAYELIILPIELLSFQAEVIYEKEVLLSWQTASEINNDFFTLERSQHGFEWEAFARVNSKGENGISDYQLIDDSPFLGLSYYRLKQTDFDGSSNYSSIRAVNIAGPKIDVRAYPNPTTQFLTLEIDGNSYDYWSYQLYNLLGQLILEAPFTSSSMTISMDEFASGAYLIRLNFKQQALKSFKIIKTKK